MTRHGHPFAGKLLKAVPEHWSIPLAEDVSSDLNNQVRSDTENVGIKGRVVDFAQGQTVGNHWLTIGLTVANDVRGIKKLGVAQPTQGASVIVGSKHSCTKHRLVNADTG